jgi:hypothetical protein
MFGIGVLTSDLLLLVVAVLDTSHEDGSLVREDQAILDQVLVARVQDGVEHGLVQQEVAHPLGYYYVDLVEGQNNLLHLSLQQGDLVRHAVDFDNLLRLVDDGRHIDTNDVLRTCLYGEPISHVSVAARVWFVGGGEREHAKDGGTASDVEDDLVLEQVWVLVDGIAVALRADFIFLHACVSRMFVEALSLWGRVGLAYQHFLVDAFTRALVIVS